MRILVVDDSRDSAILLARVLGDHNVIYCTTEEEVCDTFKCFDPELIIFDFMIHNTNALEIYERLAEVYVMPIIFCISGYQPREVGLTLKDSPFSAWLQKPFNRHELKDAVKALEMGFAPRTVASLSAFASTS